ncbi:putative oligopeptide ABC transporter, ATP-binding protein [Mycolicibacterium litorale]|uniref:Putative oligopeptide ABC transporter, ATP-binding protein n=1 Tax=Mycolicibacterium litorale TaxID=758802 RepID=A0A6S6PGU0_9MYCO|nr:ABC transporter ATP-binding protein [Mycolicibacterium litorale]BCI55198.1 putative oligopeptide ABC transporter, ATP-binding protein [Mycolicibacterium litorale]
MLSFADVSVTFTTERGTAQALRGFDLDVREGEIVAVVGESGSGKSVSMRAAMGLLPPSAAVSGQIRFGGTDLVGLDESRFSALRGKDLAMIFQEPSVALSPVYSIGQQLVETFRLHQDMSRDESRSYAVQMLASVGLPDPEKRLKSFPHQLSGGQKQRVTIAMALAMRPKVIIADEPTTALDVTVQAAVLDLLRECRDQHGSTIVLITHNMGVVADLADRVVVMRDGRIVEQGTTEQIFAAPAEPYTRELIAAVPTIPQPSSVEQAEPEPEQTAAPVLSVEDLRVTYGSGRHAVTAVDGVSFTLGPGRLLGLVGESGSGKSTIAQCLTGLLTPTSGRITLLGQDLGTVRGRARRELTGSLGVVFQDPRASIYPRRTVAEAIREPLDIHRVGTPRSRAERVVKMLDAVHLPTSFADRFPHELSGGQRQRVAIARALAMDPALVIADEPTSALDVSVQAHVVELLRELIGELGFGCVLITHDLGVVATVADDIVVLQSGSVAEAGRARDVLTRPQSSYTQQLVASVPVPDPVVQRRRRSERLVGAAN